MQIGKKIRTNGVIDHKFMMDQALKKSKILTF
jgi:hypothetical protein